MQIKTGDTVVFYSGKWWIEGKVEAIKGVLSSPIFHRWCRYKVNGQWYSNPQFLDVRDNFSPVGGTGSLVRVVDKFYKIPVTLPQYWMEMMGYYPRDCRYVAIYYAGSKATWSDGHSCCTFSYFGAFAPLTEHPAIAVHIAGLDLGSDDSEATHCLLMDCNDPKNIELYIAPYREGMKFIRDAAPELPKVEMTAEELEQALQEFMQKDLRTLGMFEMFLGHSQEQYHLVEKLIQHLDKYLPSCLEDWVKEFKQYRRTHASKL